MAESARSIKARFRAVCAHRPQRGATIGAVAVAFALLLCALCGGGVYAGGRNAVVTDPLKTPVLPSVTEKGEETSPPDKETAQRGWHWPLLQTAGTVSATYGTREGVFHRGVDIVADVGDPVVAVADGTVIACEGRTFNGGYGMTVTIDHGNGLCTLYAHLDSVAVAVGDTVLAGQTIATAGMTGDTTGPCLHFEVWVNGEAVDPLMHLAVTIGAFSTTETMREGKENTNGE